MTVPYSQQPVRFYTCGDVRIASFISGKEHNIDPATVASFGNEWKKFPNLPTKELAKIGDDYFDIVDSKTLNTKTTILDLGCGSGRWALYAAGKGGFVEAIDPSEAVFFAARELKDQQNIRWTQASVDNIPFPDGSFDLVVCLGVLHHVPDPLAALKAAVSKLKTEGKILLYLYYALDNRGILYRILFSFVNIFRLFICRQRSSLKQYTCDLIALLIYWPLARLAWVCKKVLRGSGFYAKMPLSYYHDKSFYVMRNDALDRFGTPLEKRFRKEEMTRLMTEAGLTDIVFSDNAPFWHALGAKRS